MNRHFFLMFFWYIHTWVLIFFIWQIFLCTCTQIFHIFPEIIQIHKDGLVDEIVCGAREFILVSSAVCEMKINISLSKGLYRIWDVSRTFNLLWNITAGVIYFSLKQLVKFLIYIHPFCVQYVPVLIRF